MKYEQLNRDIDTKLLTYTKRLEKLMRRSTKRFVT